jgi:hypothetical protein
MTDLFNNIWRSNYYTIFIIAFLLLLFKAAATLASSQACFAKDILIARKIAKKFNV